ncbi:MAG: nucleotidyl transferase AbiEii/AbiGii toxin family protein [Prolixibacteraceae bacterium]
MNKLYKEQVRLLLRILPIIYREENFAVHGGTVISLFISNLPRYSVGVDVTYISSECFCCESNFINYAQRAINSFSEQFDKFFIHKLILVIDI